MRLRLSILAALTGLSAGLSGLANAQDATDPVRVEPSISIGTETADAVAAEDDLARIVEHSEAEIDGETVQVRIRRDSEGNAEIDAGPIFEALGSTYEIDGSILAYYRFQDAATITLDMADGKVRANNVVLGKLPDFRTRETADTWIDANAISVLTGTQVTETPQGTYNLKLDERLKPQFDLELWVNGRPVETLGADPRTIGPILLLPLRPVAEAYGHEVREENGVVSVRRIQDSAEISLELATGLVSVNGVPRGVSPNMNYAERQALLLPFSAVETLTGTHIRLAPGSDRIEVELDDRLSGGVLPGAFVSEEAAKTPFTPETLTYQLSDRGPARVEFASRMGRYNSNLTYESAGGLSEPDALQPSWLSLDVQSLDGWVGSAGDYAATFRELDGVGETRIRGVSYRKRRPSGTMLAVAAGVPLSGSEPVGGRGSVPTFSGLAAGARLITKEGDREIGASLRMSESGERTAGVISAQQQFISEPKKTGFQSVYVSGDVGAFTGEDAAADIRFRAEARYRPTEQTGVTATLSHEGAQFLRSQFENVFGDEPGARTTGRLSGDWRSADSWGVLDHLAVGAQASYTRVGGPAGSETMALSMSANTRIGASGPNLSLDAGMASAEAGGAETTTQSLRVRAFQPFKWGTVQASYAHTESAGKTSQLFQGTVQLDAYRRDLGKGARVSIGPSASVAWSPEASDARLGATLSADSGSYFGDRLSVAGDIAALSDFAAENEEATRFFANLRARYRVTDNMALNLSYVDDFAGRNDLAVSLQGRISFNAPRKHTQPDTGRGVLTGVVFIDENRDGIRQEGERGLSSAEVAIRGTRLSLGVDPTGNFTIQNLKSGLYALSLVRSSLPLGYSLGEGFDAKITIGEGRRTHLDIPVVVAGQVRGAAFIDTNGNGAVDRGETRLEGVWIRLLNTEGEVVRELQSASFGQYGFEGLTPGNYVARVEVGKHDHDFPVIVSGDELMSIVPLAIPDSASQDKPREQGVTLLGTA